MGEHARDICKFGLVAFRMLTSTTWPPPLNKRRGTTWNLFICKTYPRGSFDTRLLNFSNLSATFSIRKFLLEKIFLTYPQPKFVLVADTSKGDVMSDYPQMATDFPNQLLCIFQRNTSSTYSGNKLPYDTEAFKNLDPQSYMFFNLPVSFYFILPSPNPRLTSSPSL